MVHVHDVVNAAFLAATNTQSNGQVYLVTDGEIYSTRQIYEWICGASGLRIPAWNIPLAPLHGIAKALDLLARLLRRDMPLGSDALQKLVGSACYSNEKISRELGYRPIHTLHESLPEMISTVQRGTTSAS